MHVYSIEIRRYEWPELELAVHCGKGTYIRSIARELGAALGTGGHCQSLRRLGVGPFDVTGAISLAQVPEPLTEADLLPIDAAIQMVNDHMQRLGQTDST